MKSNKLNFILTMLLGALCLPWSTAQAQPATFGNALSLNGVKQYVSITNGIDFAGPQHFFTISVP